MKDLQLLLCALLLSILPIDGIAHANDGSPHGVAQVGQITGQVLDNVVNRDDIDVGLKTLHGIGIHLIHDGKKTQFTKTNSDGRFLFSDLAQGNYEVRAIAPDGRSATAPLDVAAGLTTTINFLVVAKKKQGIFPSYAAVAVESSTANPDLNNDGIVNLADLGSLQRNLGADLEKFPQGDLNSDEVLNKKDLRRIQEVFGRVTLRVPAKYQAQVTPGGSVASLADGKIFIRSVSGATTGMLSRGRRPGTVRYEIIEDRGSAESSQLGTFRFEENSKEPSWVQVDLDTGRVLKGKLTLKLTGEHFPVPVDLSAEIPDGMITFAPYGFSLYHLVNVHGNLPGSFPGLGGAAFVMRKCDHPKKDKPCALEKVSPGADPSCPQGGIRCTSPGARCANGGQCGTCRTVINSGGPAGQRCAGCLCF